MAARRLGPDVNCAVAVNGHNRVSSAEVFWRVQRLEVLEAVLVVTDVRVGSCVKDKAVVQGVGGLAKGSALWLSADGADETSGRARLI